LFEKAIKRWASLDLACQEISKESKSVVYNWKNTTATTAVSLSAFTTERCVARGYSCHGRTLTNMPATLMDVRSRL